MLTCAGELTLHSPRHASMAGSVRDVTAHLLDDAQPDAMSQAEPLAVQEIVQTVSEVPAPVAAMPSRPAGEPTAQGSPPSIQLCPACLCKPISTRVQCCKSMFTMTLWAFIEILGPVLSLV